MTLDEAIEHAEERATACDDECGQEHAQLAGWLRELRDIRKIWDNLITAYEGVCRKYNESDDSYIATISYLYGRVARAEAENMRLQESYDNLRNAMWDKANARAIDFMEEDELRATCADLFDYNDELKQLARDMWTCVSEGEWDCSDCPRYVVCNDGVSEFRDRMRDLGIEADR